MILKILKVAAGIVVIDLFILFSSMAQLAVEGNGPGRYVSPAWQLSFWSVQAKTVIKVVAYIDHQNRSR